MKTIRLFIMMNPVKDILTTKIVGFEYPIRDSVFIYSNCKLPINVRKNEEIIEIGKIISANDELQKIKQVWWQICKIQLNENIALDIIDEYINKEERIFFDALNGSLYSNNGFNSGYKWDGILINNWKHVMKITNQLNADSQ